MKVDIRIVGTGVPTNKPTRRYSKVASIVNLSKGELPAVANGKKTVPLHVAGLSINT